MHYGQQNITSVQVVKSDTALLGDIIKCHKSFVFAVYPTYLPGSYSSKMIPTAILGHLLTNSVDHMERAV